MKTSALTFFAGLAVGAAIFQVSDRLIFGRRTETSDAGQRIQQSTGGQPGERARSNRKSRTSDGREVDSAILLERIEEMRTFTDLDFSNLQIGRLIADIGSLSESEAQTLLTEMEKLEESDDWNDPLEEVCRTIMLRLIELKGLEAVVDFENNRYPVFMERFGEDMAPSLLSFWSGHDPEAARDWLLSRLNAAPDDRGILSGHLDDSDILEAFFLNYEKQRPGESMALQSGVSSTELREQFTRHALNARIRLAEGAGHISAVLNEGVGLVDDETFNELVETAVESDWRATTEWVEGFEAPENREQSILTVGRGLIDHSGLERDEAIQWVLEQNLNSETSRIERLHILANAFGIHRTNVDFINPVDQVTIPGIPASPVTDNSIDAILNNPNRQTLGRFERLFDRAEDAYEGRFQEAIRNELRELLPEYTAPELPNSVSGE